MRFFDRFRKPPTESSVTRRRVRDVPGPLTAHEAWALVRPAVRALDSEARLTLLTSGTDVGPAGRSFTWEFGFELPRRRRYALLSIEPSGEGTDIDDDPIVLVERLRPMGDADIGRRPVLPASFRDSPEAVAELAAQGVDFVAGPSDLSLSARVLPSGEAIWTTCAWGEERTVPFQAVSKNA